MKREGYRHDGPIPPMLLANRFGIEAVMQALRIYFPKETQSPAEYRGRCNALKKYLEAKEKVLTPILNSGKMSLKGGDQT